MRFEDLIARYEPLYRDGWDPHGKARLERLTHAGMLPEGLPGSRGFCLVRSFRECAAGHGFGKQGLLDFLEWQGAGHLALLRAWK